MQFVHPRSTKEFTRTRSEMPVRSRIELEFGNVSFWGEEKTGVPWEKYLGAEKRTNNELNAHMALVHWHIFAHKLHNTRLTVNFINYFFTRTVKQFSNKTGFYHNYRMSMLALCALTTNSLKSNVNLIAFSRLTCKTFGDCWSGAGGGSTCNRIVVLNGLEKACFNGQKIGGEKTHDTPWWSQPSNNSRAIGMLVWTSSISSYSVAKCNAVARRYLQINKYSHVQWIF